MVDSNWEQIIENAYGLLSNKSLDDVYKQRLDFEFKEIEKQGAGSYWADIINNGKKFKSNPNNLVLPWLFGLVDSDPIKNRKDPILCTAKASTIKEYISQYGDIPSDMIKDQDMPDIDLDCLPEARDPIKEYAMEKYGIGLNGDGYGPVCSVGTWQTYKFKSAIMDVSKALLAADQAEVYELTTKLPEDVDGLKDGGYSTCKGKFIDQRTNNELDCGKSHNQVICPYCGSEDTDSPTIGKLLAEYENLAKFNKQYPKVIEYAVKLVGRIRNMGMHAGAIIIADRSLYGNIPLAKNSGKGYWITMWTEGRNTQLSKFGYSKWDILGLKTLEYIYKCSKLIEVNRGITFGKPSDDYVLGSGPLMDGWDENDPTKNQAGYYYDGNIEKQIICLNDMHALKLANEQKTDAVFQFDTDLAKSILANGVRSFEDLLFYNAAGHPGPMASIPEAVANRDDKSKKWQKNLSNIHERLFKILEDTYGIILWQEQLAAIWQELAGFAAPEAQEARKAVAKKWTHKLKYIGEKWVKGATKTIGEQNAKAQWEKMVTFGRYAFNKSHGVSYCLVALKCLWLKAHFAPEFWAAVMSDCHPDKLVRYMSVARAEDWEPTDITYCGKYKPQKASRGVKFGTLNINNLTTNYTVTGDVVNQGLIGIKKIGEKAAEIFAGKGEWTDIDHFVQHSPDRKNKIVLERFIKLGAFSHLPGHKNAYALWQYYQYAYCSTSASFKNEIKEKLLIKQGWNDKTIAEERQRQVSEFKKIYPGRKKIPAKFHNWTPKPNDSREEIISLYDRDFTQAQKLEFQKEFLGYYLDSPLDLFMVKGDKTLKQAKILGLEDENAIIEVMIVSFEMAESKPKNGKPGGVKYGRITVTDGVQRALIFIWGNEIARQDETSYAEGTGVRMTVKYDKQRGTFSVVNGTNLIKLKIRDTNATV